MKATLAPCSLALLCLLSRPLLGFCGFYVAKADTKLFNKASQVVLVRFEDKTVMTMANDFRGDPKEFAIVIPVPTVLERGQVQVGDKAVLDHLDAYSAPRLVEYFDQDPCRRVLEGEFSINRAAAPAGSAKTKADALGVTIEAKYTVGEYDILILSAKESGGLETWLRQNGYRVPYGASTVLGSYLKQGMRFFVAKVNLKEQARLGYTMLRPIRVAYESPKFMLPIRLGMANADGPQELFVYALTRNGRVETTNYRTTKLPTGMTIPLYVKETFGEFYKSMFAEQTKKEDSRAVFTEYAWDMAWCDPCAANPLTKDELRKLGVFWIEDAQQPDAYKRPIGIVPGGGAQNAYLTRLHARYDGDHFPEDLVFQETADRASFQARYVLQHAWTGSPEQCSEAGRYFEDLKKRREQEAETLANLTGWSIADIRKKMKLEPAKIAPAEKKWWEKING
jgi:hypothetical protein